MKTPPMAGGWTKYWKTRLVIAVVIVLCALIADPTMIAIVPTIVMRTGTQRAFVWVASHGRAARSARMSTEWNDWRKAEPMDRRPPGVDIAAVEAPDAVLPAVAPDGRSWTAAASTSPSTPAVAARWRRRASARSVLLARANGVSCPGLGRGA